MNGRQGLRPFAMTQTRGEGRAATPKDDTSAERGTRRGTFLRVRECFYEICSRFKAPEHASAMASLGHSGKFSVTRPGAAEEAVFAAVLPTLERSRGRALRGAQSCQGTDARLSWRGLRHRPVTAKRGRGVARVHATPRRGSVSLGRYGRRGRSGGEFEHPHR